MRMADGFEHFQPAGFNDGDGLRAFDGRESFQKIFNGFAPFQRVNQILQGDTRADKYGRAAHDFGVGVDDAFQISYCQLWLKYACRRICHAPTPTWRVRQPFCDGTSVDRKQVLHIRIFPLPSPARIRRHGQKLPKAITEEAARLNKIKCPPKGTRRRQTSAVAWLWRDKLAAQAKSAARQSRNQRSIGHKRSQRSQRKTT